MTVNPPHVYISLTTIDSRVERVDQTVRSLLEQDYANISVILHLSKEPYLLDKGVPHLPGALEQLRREDSRFSVRWVSNIGPYRKLLPLLAALGDRGAFIATTDDDTIYPRDWLSSLMAHHERYRCVIANRAHAILVQGGQLMPYRSWMNGSIVRNPDLMMLPTGKDGILYHTSYFPPGVLDYVKAKAVAPTADDVWFRWHTAMTNTPVYCVSTDYRTSTLPSTDERPISLYNNYNKNGGNDDIISRMDEWAKAERQFDIVAAAMDGGHYRGSR